MFVLPGHELWMKPNGPARQRRRHRFGARAGYRSSAGGRCVAEDCMKVLVERFRQSGVRPKVGGELKWLTRILLIWRNNAVLPHLFEELYLCLAKHVDRLHRVADKEATAAIA